MDNSQLQLLNTDEDGLILPPPIIQFDDSYYQ